MALPYIFATTSAGNVPASELDSNFNAVGAMGVTSCTASGTNSITLTQAANQPTIASYVDKQLISFEPGATSTGALTCNLNSIGSVNIYLGNGVQANAGHLQINTCVIMAYNSVFGGFVIISVSNIGQTPGTNTNDSASTGNVGEYVSSTLSSGSATSLTNNTDKNVTSISLTAGDWDVWATPIFIGNVATTVTNLNAFISATSGTEDNTPGNASYAFFAGGTIFNTTTAVTLPINPVRVSINSTTTYYMIAKALFSVNTCSAYGIIQARRRR